MFEAIALASIIGLRASWDAPQGLVENYTTVVIEDGVARVPVTIPGTEQQYLFEIQDAIKELTVEVRACNVIGCSDPASVTVKKLGKSGNLKIIAQ